MGALPLVALAAAISAVSADPGALTSAASAAPALSEPAALAAPAPVSPAASSTASGVLGTLTLPALAVPALGSVAIGLGLDWYRGGNFLLPGATSQQSGLALAASAGVARSLEVYGALRFRDSNLFSSAGRQTLGSWGDTDVGLKLLLPRAGAILAGALVELDVPAGVGSFSLKGTGGRLALLGGLAGSVGRVPLALTAVAGYQLDNTGKLVSAQLGTFPSFALGISRYDAVQGALSLQAPLRNGAPVVELSVEAPVARATPLPAGGSPVRTELLLGVAALRTGISGLTATAGVRLSLSRTGRLDPAALPLPGFAPEAPWSLLGGVSWAFDVHLPRPESPPFTGSPSLDAEAAPQPPAPVGAPLRAQLQIVVADARTQLPLAGAWVSILESADVGKTTGADGRAQLEAAPGAVTLAVARDGYELVTEPVQAAAGLARHLSIALQPLPADSTARGRLLSGDGQPLRANVEVLSAAAQPGSTVAGANVLDGKLFEGEYALALPHGSYLIVAAAPGYRAQPTRIELRPGETVSRDLVLRRIAGEPTARVSGAVVEFASRIPFAPGTASLLPSAQAALAALAAVLAKDGGLPLELVVRVEAADLGPGPVDAVRALALSEERARALAGALVAKGAPRSLLSARGLGAAKTGEPLIELRMAPVR